MGFQGKFGIHFPIHQPGWIKYSSSDLLRLAKEAAGNGFECIWINDNFKARHTYSLMAAIASQFPVSLGTLVTHPFARNPADVATALGTIAELMDHKELKVGISTGAWAIQGQLVQRPMPTQSVREAILIARQLLAGGEVEFRDFPALAGYYHFKLNGQAKLRLQVEPRSLVSFWIPPKGPRMLQVAAEVCDGVIFNTYTQYAGLPFIRNGTLERTIKEMEEMRSAVKNLTPLRKILKVDISLAEHGDSARAFARNYVSFNAALHAENYRGFGLPETELDKLQASYRSGASVEEAAKFVGRELIDWVVLAGTPAEVSDRFAEYVDYADRLDFEEVILAVPTGPDAFEAVHLAARDLLPRVVGRRGTKTY